MEFLVNGAIHYNEPGVFLAFEENAGGTGAKRRFSGFRLKGIDQTKKTHYRLCKDRAYRDQEEAGECDLDGLFIRLGHAMEAGSERSGWRLTPFEVLFGALPNQGILLSRIAPFIPLA